jgi:N-methylhydantoinase A
VLIPATASVHGAVGLVASDVMYQDGSFERAPVPVPSGRVNNVFAPLMCRIRGSLHKAAFADRHITIQRSVDIRYRYQVHELNVPFPPGDADLTDADLEALYARFDALYEEAHGKGSAYRAAGKEIVTFRVTGSGALPKPALVPSKTGPSDPASARKGERPIYFVEYGEYVSTGLYDIGLMRCGMEIAGPAIIETPITTIVINPGDGAVMDEFGNIRIAVGLSHGRA